MYIHAQEVRFIYFWEGENIELEYAGIWLKPTVEKHWPEASKTSI